jgi:hypothetical protein
VVYYVLIGIETGIGISVVISNASVVVIIMIVRVVTSYWVPGEIYFTQCHWWQ